MLDSVGGDVIAGLGMMACCGLSMAVALGLIAFTSTWVISGVAVAVVAGCVVAMVLIGHDHRHPNDHHESPEHAAKITG